MTAISEVFEETDPGVAEENGAPVHRVVSEGHQSNSLDVKVR